VIGSCSVEEQGVETKLATFPVPNLNQQFREASNQLQQCLFNVTESSRSSRSISANFLFRKIDSAFSCYSEGDEERIKESCLLELRLAVHQCTALENSEFPKDSFVHKQHHDPDLGEFQISEQSFGNKDIKTMCQDPKIAKLTRGKSRSLLGEANKAFSVLSEGAKSIFKKNNPDSDPTFQALAMREYWTQQWTSMIEVMLAQKAELLIRKSTWQATLAKQVGNKFDWGVIQSVPELLPSNWSCSAIDNLDLVNHFENENFNYYSQEFESQKRSLTGKSIAVWLSEPLDQVEERLSLIDDGLNALCFNSKIKRPKFIEVLKLVNDNATLNEALSLFDDISLMAFNRFAHEKFVQYNKKIRMTEKFQNSELNRLERFALGYCLTNQYAEDDRKRESTPIYKFWNYDALDVASFVIDFFGFVGGVASMALDEISHQRQMVSIQISYSMAQLNHNISKSEDTYNRLLVGEQNYFQMLGVDKIRRFINVAAAGVLVVPAGAKAVKVLRAHSYKAFINALQNPAVIKASARLLHTPIDEQSFKIIRKLLDPTNRPNSISAVMPKNASDRILRPIIDKIFSIMDAILSKSNKLGQEISHSILALKSLADSRITFLLPSQIFNLRKASNGVDINADVNSMVSMLQNTKNRSQVKQRLNDFLESRLNKSKQKDFDISEAIESCTL
nr:hypothetical protein [Oligoflexales bacterium]